MLMTDVYTHFSNNNAAVRDVSLKQGKRGDTVSLTFLPSDSTEREVTMSAEHWHDSDEVVVTTHYGSAYSSTTLPKDSSLEQIIWTIADNADRASRVNQ